MKISALKTGGLAAWSIQHPVGVSVIAIAIIVLGLFSLSRLSVDLNPRLIYPEVRVRILEPGVPATVMEDRYTRQLEEQLAITEDVISVQSNSSEGASSVDLSFEYGKDIDLALRDASNRLDRAKRFIPETTDPPIIYKRDPSQIPVMEFIVSSSLRDPIELRSWVDNQFGKWFITLPGVAATEVGGGLIREIHIQPDQQRLAAVGLQIQDIITSLQRGNQDNPAGRLTMINRELSGRVSGRLKRVEDIAMLPIALSDGTMIRLNEVAEVIDTHAEERLRVRLNSIPGVKLTIQKQPSANTVAVSNVVQERIEWLKKQNILPEDIIIETISDQSIYIKRALNNSVLAAISGSILSMLVVYLFLGNLRRTLIIGSAIPIAIMVTLILMKLGNLTLNIMTLGGLALGVGLLVDNTIVMLENIYRHQSDGESNFEAGEHAAKEVNSVIVASTSTNLAAVLPFLFIGGLTGLLFRELIFTISAAVLSSMIIALTLVPAFAARVNISGSSSLRNTVDSCLVWLQGNYIKIISLSLRFRWLVLTTFFLLFVFSIYSFSAKKEIFLPAMDDGRVMISLTADPGISINEMDSNVRTIEGLLESEADVAHVFTLVGGFIFGRTEREIPNRSTLTVQLVPLSQRTMSSGQWVRRMTKLFSSQEIAGLSIRMRTLGVRGIRTNRGDDDISLRIQGESLDKLEMIADETVLRLKEIPGLRNVIHSAEEVRHELDINIDRDRANHLNLDVADISTAMRIALQGIVVTDFFDNDRSYSVRIKLPWSDVSNPEDLESILLFPASREQEAIYLGDVASVDYIAAPAKVLRDNQQRIVEVTASMDRTVSLSQLLINIDSQLEEIALPKGYTLYDGGAKKLLQDNQSLGKTLVLLALFLIFVVMAIQYESLLNPLVILLSIPFSIIGVVLGMWATAIPLSEVDPISRTRHLKK